MKQTMILLFEGEIDSMEVNRSHNNCSCEVGIEIYEAYGGDIYNYVKKLKIISLP